MCTNGHVCVCMYVSLCVWGEGGCQRSNWSVIPQDAVHLVVGWNYPGRPGWLASGPKGLSCSFSSAGLQPHVTMPGLFFAGDSWVLNPNSHASESKCFPTEPACDLGSHLEQGQGKSLVTALAQMAVTPDWAGTTCSGGTLAMSDGH